MTTALIPNEATFIGQDSDEPLDEIAAVSSDIETEATSEDTEEVLFASIAAKVLQAAGRSQKCHREELLSFLPFFGNYESKLSQVMALVEKIGSQEAITAGIDLMTGFGDAVVDKAFKRPK